MWGAPLVEPSVFWDLIGTLFLLPLITGALTTAAIRRDIRRGVAASGSARASAAARRGARLAAGRRARRGRRSSAWRPPLLLRARRARLPGAERLAVRRLAHRASRSPSALLVTPLLAILAMAEPERVRVWVDCTAAAHPLVLRPIIERLEARGDEVFVTAREYGQTEGMLERLGIPYTSVGGHAGRLDAGQGAGGGGALGRAGEAGLEAAARPGDRPRLGRPRASSRPPSGSPRRRCRTTSSPACSARSPSGSRSGSWSPTRSRSSG